MVPWMAWIRVQEKTGRERCLRIWLPLFVVWLVLLPLMLVLFPLVALAGVFVRVNAVQLYGAVWGVLNSLKRTLVEVESPDVSVRVKVA